MADDAQTAFTKSPLLDRLCHLEAQAYAVIQALPAEERAALKKYATFALVRRRQVIAEVPTGQWQFDLAASLAAVQFARERVQAEEFTTPVVRSMMRERLTALCGDVTKPWYSFALRNARRPVMISMPSLPALNLGVDEERYYVQAISDTWPGKVVSHVEGNVLKISEQASRLFVDNTMIGDLGDVELSLSEHEISFIGNCSVGWVTKYEMVSRSVTLIEVDPWAKGELRLDIDARITAYKLLGVGEQRLDMYAKGKKMHEDESFQDNFILSRLLTLDQHLSEIVETTEVINVGDYIHVKGSLHPGLGPVDEEVFMKSLGSITAQNKLRSALAIAAKARLVQLRERGAGIEDVLEGNGPSIRSRLIRCTVDGIYVSTRVPLDSVLVLVVSVMLAVLGARELIIEEGVRSFGEALALALILSLGTSLSYHNLRYKSWPLSETIRLRRLCMSDEEMYHSMSKAEVIRTIADAGSKGTQMDGILTCPFSSSTNGRFSVTLPLSLEEASKAGLKLRLNTALIPVWVDLKGVRAVEKNDEVWHAYGPYLETNYLELTASGPRFVGLENLEGGGNKYTPRRLCGS